MKNEKNISVNFTNYFPLSTSWENLFWMNSKGSVFLGPAGILEGKLFSLPGNQMSA